jgi:hypothetical protein
MTNWESPLRLQVAYRFAFEDGTGARFDVDVDLSDRNARPFAANSRPWTALGFHRCQRCPLTSDAHADCPAALSIADIIDRFSGSVSWSKVICHVEFPERTITAERPLQEALYSLLGLRMAVSSCPHLAAFRPMARFHEPFSSPLSTTYRATSTWLLRQYFLERDGESADWSLDGLQGFYEEIGVVNAGMAARLRAAAEKDAILNSLVILDLFGSTMSFMLDDSMATIRELFV